MNATPSDPYQNIPPQEGEAYWSSTQPTPPPPPAYSPPAAPYPSPTSPPPYGPGYPPQGNYAPGYPPQASYAPGYPYSVPQEPSPILGIMALVMAFLAWPVGLILSIVGLVKSKNARTARTLSAVALVLSIIFGVGTIFIFSLAASVANDDPYMYNQNDTSLNQDDNDAYPTPGNASANEDSAYKAMPDLAASVPVML